ncbi:Gx transporter family protein [Paenibacillus assamensis]|uniref:Gx transporter family protein n=1 Tax=Paenibacillus assamensis TaxID=311244 RepID=UPI000420FE82|nr:Gx transporter family protein [Paenibacillus assamensis]
MRLSANDSSVSSSLKLRKTVIIAIFAAVAAVLGLVEAMLPTQMFMMIPGAKLGLANIMVLTCLCFLSWRDSMALVILKALIMTLIYGAFSAFLFSFLGALFSFIVMYGLIRIGRGRLSLIGISVMGGVAHNVGQLTAAYIVFQTTKIYYYLPALMLLGIVTGIFIGIAVKYVVASLSKLSLFEPFAPEMQ